MRKGWEDATLAECTVGKASYGANAAAVDFDPALPRYLRITDIDENGYLIVENPKSINHADAKGNYLERGDIVFARSGATVGKTYLHNSEQVLAYAGYLIRFRPDRKRVLPEYLFLFTQSDHYKTWIKNNLRAGAQPNVNAQEYSDLLIPLPPLPEQRKIAAILRTWDDAIEKTESLIKANEKRLFLLTTSLIFGHARLGKRPTHERAQHKWVSSPKDWKLQQIGDIAAERSELNTGGATHTVLSCSKHDGFVRSLDYFKKQIFSKNLAGYKTIYRGDFGFPSNHVEEGSIGLQNLEDKALVSPIYIIFTPDEKRIHADFLFRLLKTKTYAHIFRASTSSSVDRRGNLRWAEFSSIPVCLPDLKEQQEISAFLKGQQNLIDDLYRYKHALQSQKRGLMQKLLTGEWRVQVDKEAA
ncbi:MAG: restriction endonuclease subunit S [Rickettsiales bacterium]|nr:restriction endonuclease subunit S [Rickettsiales bacterium]